ncbi:hypothetical protein EXU48_10595 [Occultella glacieicola]|uniref:Activator of Hsp90 ATPase homologue 1/2-like C-terminal domain-containing protein n=1 Tax=Occultella glacieicola TaxID=2518684 RepID=A0ABY2E346_9MICO|nr:SRPBCC domain-containing protein [Occultella glacieicola]TDE93910.1 hypothetical protein EXU48_10595 [Occultella glacieicola]
MTLPPIRRQVFAACELQTAYALFVSDIGSWWPVASFGCFGEGSSVTLDGSRFVETGPAGQTAVWGTIIEADPPTMVSFTWHPGREPDAASRVVVSFAAAGDGTLVTLEHDGWESFAEPAAARAQYGGGWVTVLDRYAEAASAQ